MAPKLFRPGHMTQLMSPHKRRDVWLLSGTA
jgi:hypothetical protein